MAFSTNSTAESGFSNEINVTPLIDVLLVLLIIFMVMVPLTQHGLGTTLPTLKASRISNISQPVLVEVHQDLGVIRYRINGQHIDKSQLRPRLASLMARQSVRVVVLKGDGALGFGTISGVIDTGYVAGAEHVELLTTGRQ